MCLSSPKVNKPTPAPKPLPPPPAPTIEAPDISIGQSEEGIKKKKRQAGRSLRISLGGPAGSQGSGSTSGLGTS